MHRAVPVRTGFQRLVSIKLDMLETLILRRANS